MKIRIGGNPEIEYDDLIKLFEGARAEVNIFNKNKDLTLSSGADRIVITFISEKGTY